MREILFRGKRINNGEWAEGYLYKRNRLGTGYTQYGIQIQETSTSRPWSVTVDPETVGQYTGLKDKNGKKIFADDIVKSNIALWGKDKYVVSFEETRGGWYPFACGDGCGCCEEETIGTEHVTVIGKIHDNPELAEGR